MDESKPAAGRRSDDGRIDDTPLYYRPWETHLFNGMWRLLARMGRDPSTKSDASVLAHAARRAGVSHYPEDEVPEAFRRLFDSYRSEANLNPYGWWAVRNTATRHLANRLAIKAWVEAHPETRNEVIQRPLIVVGLPRTGTTMLQRLLALDPENRPLLFWEAVEPLPPPRPETRATDPRIRHAARTVRHLNRMIPNYSRIHPLHAESPEECSILMMNSFMSDFFALYGAVPSYSQWKRTQDYRPVYEYFRLQLQILQRYVRSERWLLKAPFHLGHLDVLLKVFPDACIIQTHRDPVKSLPSACSLATKWHAAHSDRVHVGSMGPRRLEQATDRVLRAIALRDRVNRPNQFFDIRMDTLVRDPTSTIHAAYDHFGFRFDEALGSDVRKWFADNPRDKHGAHRYSLEQFGLNRELVCERFAAYRERYGFAANGKGT